ncbi:MAG TPA: DUF6141 family protein [Methanoregulaceae archaeon]|nr:DUF6141 family protein [Methanoregulaceae archaeon]
MQGPVSIDYHTFYEAQRFRQIWVWILVGFIAILMWYSFFQQIVLGEPFGNNPAPDLMLSIFLVIFGIGLPVWLLVMKLEIKVERGALFFRMFPVHPGWKSVPAREISSVMAVTYKPFREYGGWGIRFGKQGIAYTVSGDRGVLIMLKNDTSFLLGSGRSEDLEMTLRLMLDSENKEKKTGKGQDIAYL